MGREAPNLSRAKSDYDVNLLATSEQLNRKIRSLILIRTPERIFSKVKDCSQFLTSGRMNKTAQHGPQILQDFFAALGILVDPLLVVLRVDVNCGLGSAS